MEYEFVPAIECADLMDDGALPLSAPNSVDSYLSKCILGQPNSFVAKQHRLYNIQDAECRYGIDELCTLNLAVSNQAECPGGIGSMNSLSNPVQNLEY
jgi:hypothetical protein